MRKYRKWLPKLFAAMLLAIPLAASAPQETQAGIEPENIVDVGGRFKATYVGGGEANPIYIAIKKGEWIKDVSVTKPSVSKPRASKLNATTYSKMKDDEYYFVWVQTDKYDNTSGLYSTSRGSNVKWSQVVAPQTSSHSWWNTRGFVLTSNRISGDASHNISLSEGENKSKEFVVRGKDGNKMSADYQGTDCGKVGPLLIPGLPHNEAAEQLNTLFYIQLSDIEDYVEKNGMTNSKGVATMYIQSVMYVHAGPGKMYRDNIQDMNVWKNLFRNNDSFWTHYNIPIRIQMPNQPKLKQVWRLRHPTNDRSWSTQGIGKDNRLEDVQLGKPVTRTPDNSKGKAQEVTTDIKGVNTKLYCTGFWIGWMEKDNSRSTKSAKSTRGFSQGTSVGAGGTTSIDSLEDNPLWHPLQKCVLGENLVNVGADPTKKYKVTQDLRYGYHGERRNSIKGGTMTIAKFSETVNASAERPFWYQKIEKQKNIDYYQIVWLYSKVPPEGINIEHRFCSEEDFEIQLDGGKDNAATKVPHKTGKVTPLIDEGYHADVEIGSNWNNGSKLKETVPTTIQYNKHTAYLWKVEIVPEKKGLTVKNLAKTWQNNDNVYLGNYENPYLYFSTYKDQTTSGTDPKTWVYHANKMSHLAFQNIPCGITVKCYYSITVPFKILTYRSERPTGPYQKTATEQLYYMSYGHVKTKQLKASTDKFNTGIDFAVKTAVVYNCRDKRKGIKLFSPDNAYASSYATVSAADAIGEKVKNGFDDAKREYTVKAMEFPIVLAIFRAPKDNPESPLQEIGYTTVRYIYRESDKKYYKVEDEFHSLGYLQPKKWTQSWSYGHFETRSWSDGHGGGGTYTIKVTDGSGTTPYKWNEGAERAFVSFQRYDDYNDTGGDLGGSIYELDTVRYAYNGRHHPYTSELSSEPVGTLSSNNQWYNPVFGLREDGSTVAKVCYERLLD